jgi:hypothetical protein
MRITVEISRYWQGGYVAEIEYDAQSIELCTEKRTEIAAMRAGAARLRRLADRLDAMAERKVVLGKKKGRK